MKILQICHRVPFPPTDGGSLAMSNLSKGFLANGAEIEVLAINTLKHFIDLKNHSAPIPLEAVTVDTTVKFWPAFVNLFSNKSYHVSRFYNKEFEKKIIDILTHKQFDIIQLESLFVTPYLDAIRQHT